MKGKIFFLILGRGDSCLTSLTQHQRAELFHSPGDELDFFSLECGVLVGENHSISTRHGSVYRVIKF